MEKLKSSICVFLCVVCCLFCGVAQAQVKIEISSEIVGMGGLSYYQHKVARGQTLYSLSRAYGVSQAAIVGMNPKLQTTPLKTRQTILIPTENTYKQWLKSQGKEKPEPLKTEKIPNTEREFVPKPSVEQPLPVLPGITESAPKPKDTVVTTVVSSGVVSSGVGKIRGVGADGVWRGVVMLPFSGVEQTVVNNSVDFYDGLLLALNVLSSRGLKFNIKMYSTGASTDKVSQYISQGKLDDANFVIGPIYADPFDAVARWAGQNRVPAITPLGPAGMVDNPYVIQAAPVAANKYDKLRPVFGDPANNIIVLEHDTYNDSSSLGEIVPLLPASAFTMSYSRTTTSQQIAALMDPERENIVVVPVNHEGSLEDILSKLSSINSLSQRYKIRVVGTPAWRKLNNVTLDLLFRNNVCYLSSSHLDRSTADGSDFYRQYINAFGRVPSLFSARGYDVMLLVGDMLDNWGEDALVNLAGKDFEMLQTPYRFEQQNVGSKFINTQWVLVCYTPDFKIELR